MQQYINDPPVFNELCFGFFRIEPFVNLGALSKQQKWVIYLICERNLTRTQVRKEWMLHFHRNLTDQALQHCIERIAMSQFWIQKMPGGNPGYLNTQDLEILAADVYERARIDKAFDTSSILEAARVLRLNRFNLAKHALIIMKSNKTAEEYERAEVQEPCRQWINGILAKINSKAFYPIFIDSKRFLACTVEVIQGYFDKFHQIFTSTPPELLFTVDESMVNISKQRKSIVPDTMKAYLEEEFETLPHTTGMFCSNLYGAKPPLFIIIKSLKHCPVELEPLVRCGFIWLASSSTGWMDRYCFLNWVICFTLWLRQFRHGFPHLNNNKALLVLDGHSSRENPLALEVLEANNVNVVVLPSHTTHILQLFDIMLASPLKKELTALLRSRVKDESLITAPNRSASLRYLVISSLIEAWNRVCTTFNCKNGARKAGLLPVGAVEPLKSKYVRELNEKEQEVVNKRANAAANRLNINNSLLNQRIDEIRTKLEATATCKFCCRKLESFQSFQELTELSFRHSSTSSLMLGVVLHSDVNLNACF